MPLLTQILKPELFNSTTLAIAFYEQRTGLHFRDLDGVGKQVEVHVAQAVLDDLWHIGVLGTADPIPALKQAAAAVCASAGVRLSAAPGAVVSIPVDDPILVNLPIKLEAS